MGQKSACGPVIIQSRFTGPALAVTLGAIAVSQGMPVLLRYCRPLPPSPSTLISNFRVKSLASMSSIGDVAVAAGILWASIRRRWLRLRRARIWGCRPTL